jgi:16S rRNA (guanine966-N2)-methyltransferase
LDALLPKLAQEAWLYVESPPGQAPTLPQGWALHREGRTREVRYALYRAPGPRGADTLNGNISVAVPE